MKDAAELHYQAEYTKEIEVKQIARLAAIVYAMLDKLPEDHAQEILDIAEREYKDAEDAGIHGWRNQ